MNKKGFTLNELLVVLSVISILFSILLPVLDNIKAKSTAIVCMSNQSQLLKAWQMYAGDYNGKVVGGSAGIEYPFSEKYATIPLPECPGWVDLPQSETHIFFSASSLEHKINGIKAGKLFPYTDSEKLYHCPADKRYKNTPADGYYSAFGGVGGYRSYSVSAGVNGLNPEGDLGIVPVMLVSDIKRPSSKYVFVEEISGSAFNMTSWIIDPVERYWWSPLGKIVHGDSSTLGFADGHVELHKWQDANTLNMDWNNGIKWQSPPRGQDTDLRYMQKGYPYKHLLVTRGS